MISIRGLSLSEYIYTRTPGGGGSAVTRPNCWRAFCCEKKLGTASLCRCIGVQQPACKDSHASMPTNVHPATAPPPVAPSSAPTSYTSVVTTTECFVCAKPVDPETPLTETMQTLTCTCLHKHPVHTRCFDEWYNKEGSCPYCRTSAPSTAEICVQVHEAVRVSQRDLEEEVRQRKTKTMVFIVIGLCTLLMLAALVLIYSNGVQLHPDDDAHTHSHDDDEASLSHQGPSPWLIV